MWEIKNVCVGGRRMLRKGSNFPQNISLYLLVLMWKILKDF